MALVRGELLQRPHPRAGPDNGYQIAGLHLLIDKLFQRAPDLRRALEGEAQIVHNQGDRAPDLAWTQPHRRWRRRGANGRSWGLRRDRGRGQRSRRDVRELRDFLSLAVLQKLKIVRRQVRDLVPFTVGNHGVHLHQVHGDPQNRHVRRFLRGRRLRVLGLAERSKYHERDSG